MTCCKLPSPWRWRLQTFLAGFGQNYALFTCDHGNTFQLTRDAYGWFWRQKTERVGKL